VVAPVSKSTKSLNKKFLHAKVEIEGLQGIECFEAFTEEVQTLICYLGAAVYKSTKSLHQSYEPRKVEVDGL